MSARRFILGIETSNPSIAAGVALGEASGAVVETEPVEAGTRRSDDLMSAIDRVCARAGATPRDLARIVVSVGPGAYTSLRVAVTTARVLADVIEAELIAVPTWASVVRATEIPAWPTAVCLASKGETTCATVLGGNDDTGGGHVVVDAAGFEGLGVRSIVCDRHLPERIREWSQRASVPIVEPVLDAGTLVRMAASGDAACARVTPDAIGPIYAREPDAVTQWRARHG